MTKQYVSEQLPDLPEGYEWLTFAVPIGPQTTLSQVQREVTKSARAAWQSRAEQRDGSGR